MKTEKFLKKFFRNSSLFSRGGFSLTELLVYTGIFTVTTGLMIGVVSTVSNVQVREAANVEVNDQSQFVMNAIKGVLTNAKIVDIAAGTDVSTLKLRMSDSAKDPTYIYLENGIVFKKETENGTPMPLTDDSVTVSTLTFKRLVNPPGKDVVKIDMAVAYNSSDAKQQITRNFRSAVAKVSAITFDSDLLPSTDNTYNVGASNPRWLNGFFSGNVSVGGLLNVGTATSDPTGQNGSIYYNTTSNAFRGYVNGAWADFGSGGGGSGSWSVSGNNLYTTGSVGIGTSTISNKLTVLGTASISGNVGIGTTNPNVGKIVVAYTPPAVFTNAATDFAQMWQTNTAANPLGYAIATTGKHGYLVTNGGYDLNFNMDGSTVPAMTILNPSGNVGIGTTAPVSKLQVYGSAAIGTGAGVATNNGTLTLKGSTSDFQINVQDGSGRVNYLWNASAGGGTYLISSEAASRLFQQGGIFAFYGAAAGTAGASITWTGLGYLSMSDQVWFSPRGTSSDFYINNAGSVGIGTTAPVTKLQVGGAGAAFPATSGTTQSSGHVTRIKDSSNAILDIGGNGSAGFWLQSTDQTSLAANYPLLLNPNGGSVGIGTTSPGGRLDVTFPLNTGGLYLSSPGYDSDLYNAALTLRSTTKTGAQSDVVFYHAGASNYNGVYIWNYPANAVGGCCHPIAFFGTKDDGTDYSYFPGNVNVGIGTASPAQKLHVYGSGPDLRIEDTATSGNFLDLSSNTNKHWVWGVGATAPMVFGTNNTEKMRISADGNVGIGTGAPAFPVSIEKAVAGNWQLRGVNGVIYYLGHSSGYGMHINTGNTSDSIYAMQLYNGTNDLFDVYNSGKIYMRGAVGIGAVINSGYSTDYRLQVGGGSGSNGIMIRAGNTGISKLSFDYEQNANGLGRIWYNSASNSFSIYTIGTEKVSILSGGNVGIGTTNPNSLLRVEGDVAGALFKDTSNFSYYVDPGGATSAALAGNVGIGTASPGSRLHVVSEADAYFTYTDTGFQIYNSEATTGNPIRLGSAYNRSALYRNGDLDINLEGNRLYVNANVGINTSTPTTEMEIYHGSDPENASASPVGAFSIRTAASTAMVMGVSAASPYEGWIQVRHGTQAGYTYPLSLQPIGGNVGIGTTAPTARLEVANSGANAEILTLQNTYVGNGSVAYKAYFSLSNGGCNFGDGLYIGFYNTGSAGPHCTSMPGNALSLLKGGNVGIGTTSPTTKLNVNGNINLGDGTVQYNMNTDNAIIWGSGETIAAYSIKTKYKSYTNAIGQTYTYSKLQLNWHTGVEIGASPTYGGTRFFNNYPDTGTQIFSIGDGDSNIRALNNIYAAGFFYNSDARLKENFKNIENPIDKIMKLNGGTFTWKKDGTAGVGVLAQEVEKVFPETVSTDKKTGMKSVQYGNLVAPLIEAVKEQQAEIEGLEKRIEKMEDSLLVH